MKSLIFLHIFDIYLVILIGEIYGYLTFKWVPMTLWVNHTGPRLWISEVCCTNGTLGLASMLGCQPNNTWSGHWGMLEMGRMASSHAHKWRTALQRPCLCIIWSNCSNILTTDSPYLPHWNQTVKFLHNLYNILTTTHWLRWDMVKFIHNFYNRHPSVIFQAKCSHITRCLWSDIHSSTIKLSHKPSCWGKYCF